MKNLILVLAIAGIFLTSCRGEKSQISGSNKDSSGMVRVFAVNYPLAYFAQRIGGEDVEMINPIPEDIDPAYWQPKSSMNEIQSVDLILANGAGYAKWMEKVSLSSSKIVNTSAGFKDKFIEIKDGPTHSHGGDGAHSHTEIAFTTWLDFKLAIVQASAVKDALVRLIPDKAAALNQNFNGLKDELGMLDARIETLAIGVADKAIIGSHPVYQYLSQGYGLNIKSFHWEPDVMPTTVEWRDFELLAEKQKVNKMLWENNPNAEITDRLNEIGMTIIVFNPCGNKPEIGDFMSVMTENLRQLETAFVD